ncbi:MAG: ATP-binding protein [bacterium]|nr:ATP-binding protein [bacterium]
MVSIVADDLPIAKGILIAVERVPAIDPQQLFLGELSLDGTLRHTTGILPMVSLARDKGIREVYVPIADAPEAALVEGMRVYPVGTLAELDNHLRADVPIRAYIPDGRVLDVLPEFTSDMAHVRVQEHVKRALEVAAAGGHNVITVGPPGAGRTLLARSMPSILPRMSGKESIEVTKIYSVSDMLPSETPLMVQRPFRTPHHTISHDGLVGGGRWPRPEEITLAHRGFCSWTSCRSSVSTCWK